jgi:hypothetical protein
MLQEDDWPSCVRAVRSGAIGNAMHGEDVAVICSHGVDLSRVTVLNDWRRLNKKFVEDNSTAVKPVAVLLQMMTYSIKTKIMMSGEQVRTIK